MSTTFDDLLNCSVYNPCGQHGYCEDDNLGKWTCVCKFWWNGSRCEYQTNSGKQVIVLGCLVGVFMIVFHGLAIYHYIQNKKREKRKPERGELKKPKLFQLFVSTIKHSITLSSSLTIILVIFLATVTLVIKWSLLQPIHNDLVSKYLHKDPLYYNPNPICRILHSQDYNVFTFPVSCSLILIFIIRTKRRSFLPKCCHSHGALPVPVDFLSQIDRKLAAVIFAIYADELFGIAKNLINGKTKNVEGVMLVYLLHIFDVLIIGLRYYPILAAAYLNSIFTLVCGTLYAWLDLSFTIIKQGMCDTDYYPTVDRYNDTDEGSQLKQMFNYFGTGSSLVIIKVCTDIPRYFCIAYVCIKLPVMLSKKIVRRLKPKCLTIEEKIRLKSTREERVLLRSCHPDSFEMLYVRNLFHSANKRPSTRYLVGRILPNFIYEWRDDFQYSTRVVCLYSSIALLLFFTTLEACIRILPVLYTFQIYLQSLNDFVFEAFGFGDNDTSSKYRIPSLIRLFILTLTTTVVIVIIHLLASLINIRRNLFQLYRGDDCEIPRRQRSNYVTYSTNNVHFAGYFIGYLIWGFLLIALMSVIICGAIEAFIVYGRFRLIETGLKYSIPSTLFLYFKQYLNKFLSKYVFLQDAGEVISINNRRLLMIYIYLSFFLDAFLGIVSCVLRLTKGLIGGGLYMCRMDYSPLGRKLETFDGGFNAYCGFIHTECTHRHPIMLVFTSHLLTQLKLRQCNDKAMIEKYSLDKTFNSKQTKSFKAIRKWQLGVFLSRNPTIVFFRKAFLNKLNIDEIRALNDVDDDQTTNLNRRLSVYARRMSVWQPSIILQTDSAHVEDERL